ncbi:MAG TPA: C40 family peptidase [Clostridia bacterium]|nr:C40 family peptidase [Clostridia bacterium]
MRSTPRLLFSEEEQAPPEEPTPKTTQPQSSTKSNSKPENENHTIPLRTVQADNGKKAVRLYFKEIEQKEPSKLNHIAKEALAAEIHKQVDDSADDNVAVEATHRTEQAVEAGYRLTGERTHAPKAQSTRAKGMAEREADKANMSFSFVKTNRDTNKKDTNPLSRWRQRQAIKRQYAAARAGAQATANSSTVAANAVRSTTDKVKRTVQVFAKNNKGLLVVGIVGIMLVMLINGASSCAEFGVGGLNAVLGTSFVSEDSDLLQVEAHYAALEAELDRNIDRIESDYPRYDEYHYEIDEIGHNPYELLSYLSARHVSFTLSDVQNELATLLKRQYSLSIVETVEIRYRTEEQLVWVYDEETDTERWVWEDVEVPYEYKTLKTTLLNRGLTYAMGSSLNTEQIEMYAVLLESYGNKPELFAGSDNPYLASLDATPPEAYEIPPEALSDPKFAALIAEANKYLGLPYVWGGSKPGTGFDCSGFVCWVLNHSGAANVGRTNARGLYKKSTVVSRENARPGDLIFFTGARVAEIGHPVTHVGIYIGNGMMLHCAGNGVEYKSINTKYYKSHFYAFGRLG